MAGKTTRTKSLFIASALAASLLTAGCAQQGGYQDSNYGSRQTFGLLAGAALGGLLGSEIGGSGDSQLAAVAAGTLIGAVIGSEIGRGLDDVDRQRARQAEVSAARAPIGETITWSNTNSGNYGEVTSVREGTSTSGRYCREYQHTIYVGGEAEQGYGTACRQPDGSWEIL